MRKGEGQRRMLLSLLSILLSVCLTGCCFILLPPENSLPPTLETELPTIQPEETTHPAIMQPEPKAEDFVRICDYIPTARAELPYATVENFTGQIIYDFNEPWLRYGTVKKLIQVAEELEEKDLYIKIWDGFRPTAAQFQLWQVYPDPTFVADPNNGFSSHSRGNTIDITLVNADGVELLMPTGFDDFSQLADRDYSDCTKEMTEHALLLEQIMKKHGFKPYFGEWWHFSDEESYPVEEHFQPAMEARFYADCEEYIDLCVLPSVGSDTVIRIPANDEFMILAWNEDFAYVDYDGLRGYVLGTDVKPVQSD